MFHFVYLVALLVFFDELLEGGARVAEFLFAGVEDDLASRGSTTFCALMLTIQIYV